MQKRHPSTIQSQTKLQKPTTLQTSDEIQSSPAREQKQTKKKPFVSHRRHEHTVPRMYDAPRTPGLINKTMHLYQSKKNNTRSLRILR